jgi:hypothetical protein
MLDSNTKQQLENHLQKSLVVDSNNCWLWTAAKDTKGYAVLNVRGKVVRAHRLIMEYVNQTPGSLQVNHKCNIRHCINPDHLYLGTQSDNIHQAVTEGRVHPPRKTKQEIISLAKALRCLGWPLQDIADFCLIGIATASRICHGD